MSNGNRSMKAIKEIQKRSSLAFTSFIPAFPLARFYLSTYLIVLEVCYGSVNIYYSINKNVV